MRAPTLIDAPVKPMLAMWCWPQPLGQPLTLMWICARQRVVDRERLDALGERRVEPHRARDPELAAVGAGAADDVGDRARADAAPRPISLSAAPDLVDRLLAHPAQDEVLLHRRARVAAGVVAHDLRRARGTARASGRRAGSAPRR